MKIDVPLRIREAHDSILGKQTQFIVKKLSMSIEYMKLILKKQASTHICQTENNLHLALVSKGMDII